MNPIERYTAERPGGGYICTCDPGMCINKLAEYENLEEAGRLVTLPCGIGDTVYAITVDNNVAEYDVVGITIEHYRVQIELWGTNTIPIQRYVNSEDFGKEVFFTYNEAAALTEKNDGL